MPFMQKDLAVDSEGDLVVASNGDLTIAEPRETLAAAIAFRLRTDHFDFGPKPFLGANLSSLLGEPQSERTGDLAKELAHVALTQDGLVPAGTLFLDVIPTGPHTVELFAVVSDRIGTEPEPLVVTHRIDLEDPAVPEESILATDE